MQPVLDDDAIVVDVDGVPDDDVVAEPPIDTLPVEDVGWAPPAFPCKEKLPKRPQDA